MERSFELSLIDDDDAGHQPHHHRIELRCINALCTQKHEHEHETLLVSPSTNGKC